MFTFFHVTFAFPDSTGRNTNILFINSIKTWKYFNILLNNLEDTYNGFTSILLPIVRRINTIEIYFQTFQKYYSWVYNTKYLSSIKQFPQNLFYKNIISITQDLVAKGICYLPKTLILTVSHYVSDHRESRAFKMNFAIYAKQIFFN